jgi:hypothetical protein
VEQQLRRYFVGIVGFAFVATWAATGLSTAFAALAVCVVGVKVVPALRRLLDARRREAHLPRRRRRPAAGPPGTEADEPPLVPDDPSLIIRYG